MSEEEVRAEKEEQNTWNTRLAAGPLLCRQGDWRDERGYSRQMVSSGGTGANGLESIHPVNIWGAPDIMPPKMLKNKHFSGHNEGDGWGLGAGVGAATRRAPVD